MCFFCSGSWRPADSKDEVPADTVITMQRGPCERRCAVYKVVLFADGTLIYDGENWVRQRGLVQGRVEPQVLRKLVDDFKAIHYFELNTQYGYEGTNDCDSIVAGVPIVMTSISSGGQSKAIIHHHRCAGAVETKLSALEDEIDDIAHTRRWIR